MLFFAIRVDYLVSAVVNSVVVLNQLLQLMGLKIENIQSVQMGFLMGMRIARVISTLWLHGISIKKLLNKALLYRSA